MFFIQLLLSYLILLSNRLWFSHHSELSYRFYFLSHPFRCIYIRNEIQQKKRKQRKPNKEKNVS